MDQRVARETMFTFSLYADHFQFYLGDSELDGDTSAPDFWSDAAFERRLAVAHRRDGTVRHGAGRAGGARRAAV